MAKTKDLLEDEQYSALYPNHRCTKSLIETTKRLLEKHKKMKSNVTKTPTTTAQDFASNIKLSKPLESPLPFKKQPKLEKMNSHNMTFAVKEVLGEANLSHSGHDDEQDSAIGEYMDDFQKSERRIEKKSIIRSLISQQFPD